MDVKHASDLISENLTSIYGYAFARLYDKDKVDDLAGEIVAEVLGSAEKIRDDGAFWAFAWRVADNTFKKFIRRESILARAESQIDENAGDMGVYVPAESFEDELAEREERNDELYRLRRELSLLSKTHREVSVMYYVKNMSCSEIAKAENISMDMVKYHLFKTRKLLKEGIGMNRNLGEKSYNPGIFVLNFWGDYNNYSGLFRNRKLPGAIVLAAYYTPMTARELSLETGVAMPYIEDELNILETAGIIKKNGDKYQTNIVIITEAFETELTKKTKDMYPAVADKAFDDVKALLPKIRALDFSWKDADDNRLVIMALNLAFVEGYKKASPDKPMPKLPLGGHGYIHGYDSDWCKHHFRGVTLGNSDENGNFYAHIGYNVFGRHNFFNVGDWRERRNAMCSAIKEAPINDNKTATYLVENGYIKSDGKNYHANFPVFKKSSFVELIEMLLPVSEKVCVLMKEITNLAAAMLADHAPGSVKEQCADIAANTYSQDVMAILMEDLIARGKLSVPDGNDAITTWGIKD